MDLRQYQADAVASAYQYLRANPGRNPCVVLPTGAGKTPVLATICRDVVQQWRGRVLVVSHVKELVEQSAATLRRWYPTLDVGIYSAGVGKRERSNAVIVAGIQSIHNKAFDLTGSSPFNLVLVDEAHRIPPDGDGQYQRLLNDLRTANPKIRVIGLTATPYRTKGGWVCSDEHFLNEICFEVSIRQLIAQGYLSKLMSKRSQHDADLSGVSIQRGEYAAGEMEQAFEQIVDSAVDEMIGASQGRRSVLVFCAGVEHAKRVAERLNNAEGGVGLLTGDTNNALRDSIIERFKRQEFKFLCNVNVLTEGFDATAVDMVVLLRATLSPGLYYQMVGRGLRLHPGKDNCLVLDFGSNVLRHGPIDAMRIRGNSQVEGGDPPAKECPECAEVVPISYSNCPECGFAFPEPQPKPRHEPKASSEAILSGEIEDRIFEVTDVVYAVHYKRDWEEGQPRTLRVDYYDGPMKAGSEWICFEHTGWAMQSARHWWAKRSMARVPNTIEEAVSIAHLDLVRRPKRIKVRKISGQKYDRIIDYDFEGVPFEPVDDDWLADYLSRALVEDDEVPF